MHSCVIILECQPAKSLSWFVSCKIRRSKRWNSEVVIYTIKLEIVWTSYEHLYTTVHAIKSMEWQDFFFLWNCWKSFSEKLEWFGFFCDKKYEDQSAYRRLIRQQITFCKRSHQQTSQNGLWKSHIRNIHTCQ